MISYLYKAPLSHLRFYELKYINLALKYDITINMALLPSQYIKSYFYKKFNATFDQLPSILNLFPLFQSFITS